MEKLLEWVWQITCYLIFITVLMNLLPKKSYEKYIRLFAGMILILLVIKPVTGAFSLDEKLAFLFENITFQEEAEEFRHQLSDMERGQLYALVDQYENQVEEDVTAMAGAMGVQVRKTEVEVDRNPEGGSYGKILSIIIEVTEEGEKEKEGGITPVKPVEISISRGEGDSSSREDNRPAFASPVKARPEEEKALKRRIADYYGMEERYVEIQWKD